ncbi:phosphoribosylformylglycinamidine synthase subunit PurQ [bacterium]|nr:phosphoribosylformylglycinamidine synthase subunit PurQ [bacterium]
MKKVAVLSGFGLNCEEETEALYKKIGLLDVETIHLSKLFSKRRSIFEFDALHFSGGFSFGDELGSGTILAQRVRESFFDDLKKFAESRYIIGVCNGFQTLTKLGILPNIENNYEITAQLLENSSNRFENRWVKLNLHTDFLKNIKKRVIELPIRNLEGRLVFKDKKTEEAILKNSLIPLYYNDYSNGSVFNGAGLLNMNRNILGLMPHPEGYFDSYQHPDWNKNQRVLQKTPDGLEIIKNFINFI